MPHGCNSPEFFLDCTAQVTRATTGAVFCANDHALAHNADMLFQLHWEDSGSRWTVADVENGLVDVFYTRLSTSPRYSRLYVDGSVETLDYTAFTGHQFPTLDASPNSYRYYALTISVGRIVGTTERHILNRGGLARQSTATANFCSGSQSSKPHLPLHCPPLGRPPFTDRCRSQPPVTQRTNRCLILLCQRTFPATSCFTAILKFGPHFAIADTITKGRNGRLAPFHRRSIFRQTTPAVPSCPSRKFSFPARFCPCPFFFSSIYGINVCWMGHAVPIRTRNCVITTVPYIW